MDIIFVWIIAILAVMFIWLWS